MLFSVSDVIHVRHVTSWYHALLLKVSVKDDDAIVATATPEMLFDAANTQERTGKFQVSCLHPMLITSLFHRHVAEILNRNVQKDIRCFLCCLCEK